MSSIKKSEVLVELFPSGSVMKFLWDPSLPLWVAVSDAATSRSNWLLTDHQLDATVGAGVLKSLVPAVASVEEEKTAAGWSVGRDTMFGFNCEGVDEVAAVTARKALDRTSSQGGLYCPEFICCDTTGSHLDDISLVLTTLELERGGADIWHGSHLKERVVLHFNT